MAKTRRTFTPEFKAEAVRLVTEQGRSFVEAAHDLDIGESTLRSWRQALVASGERAFPGKGNPPAHEEELRRLRAEVKRLTMEREILKKSDGLLRQGVVMRYDFVERHRGRWPVRLMCRVLAVSPGGYYDWRGRPQSARAQRREALVVAVRAVHGEVKARYGSRRVHAELIARGTPCCVNTVAKLMRKHGIAAKTKRKFRCTTDSNHDRPVAENVLDRQFEPEAADRVWTADITYVATREGWLDLAAVEDLYSRRIVGWSMGERIDSRLVVDALKMAVAHRLPGAGLIAHSDRGSQYASEHYRRLLAGQGIACSMSPRANCWDNAPMESFFASLKKELVHGEDYASREEARASIFEYIEVFYNRVRRHSSLDYRSPDEYERAG
jgi:transposase InsO family protein/transposase-like protein